MSNEVAVRQHTSLVEKFAGRYSIDPEKLLPILKATAFRQKDGSEVTNEQMASLLVVADQHGLNPFTREIFAFPDKQNGIVPVVSVDGWSRIINDHPQSDGFEFRQSEDFVTMPDARPCPEWIEVIIYRKNRSHPIVVREHLDEVYRPIGFYPDGNKRKPGPWQTHTKRLLRHKALIQGARIAYGFSGIYDEDEAERIIDMDQAEVVVEQPKARKKTASPPPADQSAAASPPPGAARDAVPSSATQEESARPEPQQTVERAAEPVAAEPIQGDLMPREGIVAEGSNPPSLSECVALVDEAGDNLAIVMPTLLEYRKLLSAKDQAMLDSIIAATQANAPKAEPVKPLVEGQKRIIRARLKANNKQIDDLVAKFGPLDQIPFERFQECQKWASEA